MSKSALFSKVSWDEFFLRHAYLTSSKSIDKFTKIGSVLVREKQIISHGFNGPCIGVNDNIAERHERPEKYNFYAHSEFNAVCLAARHGIKTLGSTLYSFAIPCSNCAMACIQSGVKTIVLHKQWEDRLKELSHNKWIDSARYSTIMFNEAFVVIEYFNGVLGIKTLIDGKIVNV
jgi:dCMP deaminase